MQSLLVDWLRAHGHKIERVADTSARTPGIDIVATTHDGRALWITVKGYPQRSANVQARHWFAGAILDLVRYRDRSETALLGMGMPSGFMTYQNLAKSVSWLRRTLPFTIWWVSADGEVVSR